jgi:peptidoglycan/xylan/chitin deacetylase (PgdA/CDA1 family)
MSPLQSPEPRVRAILTYHSLDDSGSPISVSPETFRAHVRFLASGRVRVVSLGDLLALPDDQEAVALTFDDGYLSFASLALPLLEAHGLPATVFVVSDHVGRTNAWGGAPQAGIPTLPLMDWETLGRARERGVTIGAHTRRHPDLTAVAPDEQLDEIAGGAAAVEAALGDAPDAFAYPYGRSDGRVAALVRDRFAHACTTELRVLSGREDPARLPRLDAWYFSAPGQLERWGTGAFRRHLWLRASGRSVKQLVLPTAGR